MGPDRLKREIRERALDLGFNAVGITRVEKVPDQRLRPWLDKGYHGKMTYLERNVEKRLDPCQVLKDAKSFVCVRMDYFHSPSGTGSDKFEGIISRYATGEDYHVVLENRLELLLERIRELSPTTKGKAYVDTGPVLEKYWAERAGLGWIGKHTNLIAGKAGSWFFLGVIIVDLDVEPDEPMADFCGTCTRCIEACPTQAIIEPYVLDASQCISYLNIELREDIPVELRSPMGNLVFGCDICQEVCPWNRRPSESRYKGFNLFSRVVGMRELAQLTPEQFSKIYSRTPLKRAKWRGLLRNVAVALGNCGSQEVIPALKRLERCGDEIVESHARWALQQLGGLEDGDGS